MQLRSIRHDSYDQFAEIFSYRYLQYPTMPWQFLTPKKWIGPGTLSMRNMDGEWVAVLTQSISHGFLPSLPWRNVTNFYQNSVHCTCFLSMWKCCIGYMCVVLYTEWKLCNFMAIESFHCHCHCHCQSAKFWTHRVGRPPFWLIVTALDRKCYLPVLRVLRSKPEPEEE